LPHNIRQEPDLGLPALNHLHLATATGRLIECDKVGTVTVAEGGRVSGPVAARVSVSLWAHALAVAIVVLFGAAPLQAQGLDLANRPVSEIRIEGLGQVPEQFVRNNIRLKKGDPYDADVVEADVVRITHLGRFSSVVTKAEPLADGSIAVTYVVAEQAVIAEVLFTGNKQVTDQQLNKSVLMRAGDRVDPFLIDRGIRKIKSIYEKKGYDNTLVDYDRERLDEEGILLYQIREGPRPRIRVIRFEGHHAFTEQQLKSKIRARAYVPILRKGQLSREQLTLDASRLRDFYRERGYLDAEADRIIDLSPNGKDATVTFLVKEGRRYTVASIDVDGNRIFNTRQILARMALKIGDIYSKDLRDRSEAGLLDMYGKLGHLETQVNIDPLFHEREPTVNVKVTIDEGIAYLVGKVTVHGNQLTKQKVILRQVRGIHPNRPYDRTGKTTTEQRLAPSSLFKEARVTVLGEKDDEVRDALIEVKEASTGSVSFGAGVSSDAGVAGAIDLVQKNFDITDFPESFGEFLTSKAFRGAGQFFAIRLQPGNDRSLYSVTFKEPYIFDSDYFLDTNLFFFQRDRRDWNEERVGGRVGFGQRFGDIYSASLNVRVERVEIDKIDLDAPIDVFAVDGSSLLTSFGANISRNTTNNRIFPTSGSRLRAGIEQIGAMGGDFDLFKSSASFRKFWSIDEDFFGRHTVVSLRAEVGYIFDVDEITVFANDGPGGTPGTAFRISESPVFERYYAGGHRSFRAFQFRGVGPRGIIAGGPGINVAKEGGDPVGGNFLFLLGSEYNFPIFQKIVRGVLFIDSGTVLDEIGLEKYRVSVGTGIRIQVPFLGSAPFAFDLALPIVKEEGDETQVFSFDIAIPF